MGLFSRKKKPWDYDSERDKFLSIMEDYSKDKKVLKKVIKDDSNYNIKAAALINYLPRGQFISGVQMMDILLNDIGLSQKKAIKLIEIYDCHVKEIENRMNKN